MKTCKLTILVAGRYGNSTKVAVLIAPKRESEMKHSIMMMVLLVVLSKTEGLAINITGNTLQFGSFTQTK